MLFWTLQGPHPPFREIVQKTGQNLKISEFWNTPTEHQVCKYYFTLCKAIAFSLLMFSWFSFTKANFQLWALRMRGLPHIYIRWSLQCSSFFGQHLTGNCCLSLPCLSATKLKTFRPADHRREGPCDVPVLCISGLTEYFHQMESIYCKTDKIGRNKQMLKLF